MWPCSCSVRQHHVHRGCGRQGGGSRGGGSRSGGRRGCALQGRACPFLEAVCLQKLCGVVMCGVAVHGVVVHVKAVRVKAIGRGPCQRNNDGRSRGSSLGSCCWSSRGSSRRRIVRQSESRGKISANFLKCRHCTEVLSHLPPLLLNSFYFIQQVRLEMHPEQLRSWTGATAGRGRV